MFVFYLSSGNQAVAHRHWPELQAELHCCRWLQIYQDGNYSDNHRHNRTCPVLFSVNQMKLLDGKLISVFSLSLQTNETKDVVRLFSICTQRCWYYMFAYCHNVYITITHVKFGFPTSWAMHRTTTHFYPSGRTYIHKTYFCIFLFL